MSKAVNAGPPPPASPATTGTSLSPAHSFGTPAPDTQFRVAHEPNADRLPRILPAGLDTMGTRTATAKTPSTHPLGRLAPIVLGAAVSVREAGVISSPPAV